MPSLFKNNFQNILKGVIFVPFMFPHLKKNLLTRIFGLELTDFHSSKYLLYFFIVIIIRMKYVSFKDTMHTPSENRKSLNSFDENSNKQMAHVFHLKRFLLLFKLIKLIFERRFKTSKRLRTLSNEFFNGGSVFIPFLN